jgi:hypothetical protein
MAFLQSNLPTADTALALLQQARKDGFDDFQIKRDLGLGQRSDLEASIKGGLRQFSVDTRSRYGDKAVAAPTMRYQLTRCKGLQQLHRVMMYLYARSKKRRNLELILDGDATGLHYTLSGDTTWKALCSADEYTLERVQVQQKRTRAQRRQDEVNAQCLELHALYAQDELNITEYLTQRKKLQDDADEKTRREGACGER